MEKQENNGHSSIETIIRIIAWIFVFAWATWRILVRIGVVDEAILIVREIDTLAALAFIALVETITRICKLIYILWHDNNVAKTSYEDILTEELLTYKKVSYADYPSWKKEISEKYGKGNNKEEFLLYIKMKRREMKNNMETFQAVFIPIELALVTIVFSNSKVEIGTTGALIIVLLLIFIVIFYVFYYIDIKRKIKFYNDFRKNISNEK